MSTEINQVQVATMITKIAWGEMEVTINGQVLKFKDCKVWPGGAKAWDWRITGTQHQPGTQPADIQEIVDQGIEVMILSRGMDLMLRTCAETEQMLREQGIEYHILETKDAVKFFNLLTKKGQRVGGIFHSTC